MPFSNYKLLKVISIKCPVKQRNKDIVVRKLQGVLQFDFILKTFSSYVYAWKQICNQKSLLLSISFFKICIRMIEKFHVCALVIGLSIGESTREFRFRATKRHENILVLLLFLLVHFTVLDEISVQGSILWYENKMKSQL